MNSYFWSTHQVARLTRISKKMHTFLSETRESSSCKSSRLRATTIWVWNGSSSCLKREWMTCCTKRKWLTSMLGKSRLILTCLLIQRLLLVIATGLRNRWIAEKKHRIRKKQTGDCNKFSNMLSIYNIQLKIFNSSKNRHWAWIWKCTIKLDHADE